MAEIFFNLAEYLFDLSSRYYRHRIESESDILRDHFLCFYSVLMLQVSLNSGQTFVSSNVNITAKNCTEKKNEIESGGETKPEVR